ncbi:NTP transferase domain-containing protein [Patescibacteria group bacterium]|nr:NTP transferase domain-containing protein [Patescibacteria group bacterium]
MKNVAAIVLAAGKGTRINALTTNKVLFPLAGKPMIGYTAELLRKTGVSPIVVVVGFKGKEVMRFLGRGFVYVNQGKLLGTGHAVQKAMTKLPQETKQTLVLNGDDSAFYTPQLLKDLINLHLRSHAVMTVLSVERKDPIGYGRILRDRNGEVTGIREERDVTEKEKRIKEINTGAYCFSVSFLRKYLNNIRKNPVKGEYYLTDLAELAVKDNLDVEAVKVDDETVSLGVNSLEELKQADRLMRQKLKS